jgi:hypothetical protein
LDGYRRLVTDSPAARRAEDTAKECEDVGERGLYIRGRAVIMHSRLVSL